jgi:hypothetical protein
MIPRIVDVEPLPDFKLKLRFATGEWRQFNLAPWLDRGLFKEIKDSPALYNAVGISFHTLAWPNGADLDPELLYEASVPLDVPATLASEDEPPYGGKAD